MKTSPSKKSKTQFFCQSCGHQSPKWLGKCPACGEWNQFVEEEVRAAVSGAAQELKFDGAPLAIDDISAAEGERALTGVAEMDRVLGGGIPVGGSAILVGGEPGIGKTTFSLKMLHNMAAKGLKVLTSPARNRPSRSGSGESGSGPPRPTSSSSWKWTWKTFSAISGRSCLRPWSSIRSRRCTATSSLFRAGHLGPGDGAVLGHVAHQKDGNAQLLRLEDEPP